MWPFSKKEEKKSEIPNLPELPRLPRSMAPFPEYEPLPDIPELPTLPSFPNSKIGEKITNQAVKDAIYPPKESEERLEKFMIPKMTREIEIENIPSRMIPKQKLKVSNESNPVFVRIDKYQESAANFQEIKASILEIENLLRDIKEIKSKEEAELMQWESQIHDSKLKLDKIDKILFSELE